MGVWIVEPSRLRGVTSRSGERGAVAAMVAATLLWGGTFVAIRETVRVMPPQALVCGRFLAAAVLFVLLGLFRRRAPGRRGPSRRPRTWSDCRRERKAPA